jgi:hypothetical protein
MGTTYRFLATVDDGPTVLDWFRARPEPTVETPRPNGSLFYFPDCGPLLSESGRSPLVNVFLPARRRGALTTVGEVHFLGTPLSAFPALKRVDKQFRSWMRQHPLVFSNRPNVAGEWDYLLEGSVRNLDPDIFALPSGLAALQRGTYFVSEADNDRFLDLVCRKLQLRGVTGVETTVPVVRKDDVS